MASNPSTSNISDENIDPWIPRGFVLVDGPDNEQYIVPDCMFPAFQQECNAYKKKQDIGANRASGSVSTICL
jgi:hypothetical protein